MNSHVTPLKWDAERPEDIDKIPWQDQMEQDVVKAEMMSKSADAELNGMFKEAMGGKTTNAKYVSLLLDMAMKQVEEMGPSDVRAPANVGGRNITLERQVEEMALKQDETHKMMGELKAMVDIMSKRTHIASLSQPQPPVADMEEWKAVRVSMPQDNDCGYHVLDVFGAASANEKAVIAPTTEKAQLVRAQVCWQARADWDADGAAAFKLAHDNLSIDEHETRTSNKPAKDNWCGLDEGTLYTKMEEHADLEVRYMFKDKDGVTGCSSTLLDKEKPRKFVGFDVFNGTHHDVGAIQVGGKDGAVRNIFNAAEADKAQALLMEMMEGGSKGVHVAGEAPKSKDAYIAALVSRMAKNGAPARAVSWKDVVSGNEKALKKAKAGGDVGAQATLATDAIKQATKDFKTAVRDAGAQGAWGQPQAPSPWQQAGKGKAAKGSPGPNDSSKRAPPWQQSGKTATHARRQGGKQASDQVDKWGSLPKLPTKAGQQVGPAIVVFGEGDKRKLRKRLKELDAEANESVESILEIKTGKARFEIHCQASQLAVVEAFLPLLQEDGGSCAIWEPWADRKPKTGLAGKSAGGLRTSSHKAGMCHYMTAGDDCPFANKPGGCRWHCWDDQ